MVLVVVGLLERTDQALGRLLLVIAMFYLMNDGSLPGSGLVHAEISSDEFKQHGGPLEILQLWVNLPAKHKMAVPSYKGLQKEEIPVKSWDEGKVTGQIIAGDWEGVTGPVNPLTDIHIANLSFKAGGRVTFSIEKIRLFSCT